MPGVHGYYRHPTIHRDQVAFVSEDDLWLVSVDGGQATRLTASPGTVTFPRFSPDGTTLAYTSKDEGHPEAYAVEVDGGVSRRLTYLGSLTQTVGWSPQGDRVIVASDSGRPFTGYLHLHAVPAAGGPAELLPYGIARAVSFQPGGPGVVIGRNTYDPARWKRYRGGTAGTLWIDRTGDGEFELLIRLDGNLASPMWIGRRIYFISDHEGTGNLYSCTPTGRSLTRHTSHEDFYARFASTDGRSIVYHAGADLWVYDVRAATSHKIDVTVPGARSGRNRKFITPGRYLETTRLHPQGHSLAMTVRGGAFTMPLWEGSPMRHGKVSEARYRLADWLPDGRVVAVTDESGDEELVVFDVDGTAAPKTIPGDIGRPVTLRPAPAGPDRVAVTNQRQEVVIVNVATGDLTQVFRSPYQRIQGVDWSPDGRWLVFAAFTTRHNASLHLHDTEQGVTTEITRPDFVDMAPSFDPKGAYLYFLSARVFDPVYDTHYFDLGFPKGLKPYLIPLRADRPSPFSAATRLPKAPGETVGKDEAKNGDDIRVDIDLDGIADRVVAFPVPEGRYLRIAGAEQRVLFSSRPVEGSLGSSWSTGEEQPKAKLEVYDFTTDKVETVMEGISDFSLSQNRKVLAITAGQRLRVVPAGFKESNGKAAQEPGRESGWVDLERVRAEVIPGLEWRQMFKEAWRLQRDQFWRPDMSGVDWRDVAARYLPLVDRVAARSEFSDLMWEMQGELGTSHAYELGGDYRPEPQWLLGFLGADLVFDGRAWIVARLPRGDSWEPGAASPLARPGLDIREGDRIVAIDGVALDASTVPGSALVDRAGRPVRLTVRRGRRKARTVIVETLTNEFGLRYRDWVEANRERVHRESGGTVGYVHIPDMGPRGYAEFHRYYKNEVDYAGLIVDVRNNRGGHVSQLLLEKLARKRIGYDLTRYGRPEPYPDDAPMGPMVALTDEFAGSDGDIFSHAFKLYGLGPLIGKRTWGGVIGIFPRHALVDGTITTQPEFSFWFEDVGWGVENYGTDPDIEVDIKPQDFAAGRDPQLERALTEVQAIISRDRPAVPEFEEPPSRRPPRLP